MDIAGQLRTSLAAQSLPPASASFLTTLIDTRTPPPPVASLLATAKARILACDLSKSAGGLIDAASMAGFPADTGSARAEEVKLPRDVHAQVLDVENLSLSRWEQIEELEAIERGERTRGREVIRVTADDDEAGEDDARAAGTQSRGGGTVAQANQQAAAARNAVHRLTLQDCKGKTLYAVEARRIDRIGVGKTGIGEKVLVKADTVVARGSLLLTPDKTVFLGGKVEVWHEAWMNGRLARLKASVGADRPQ